MKDESNGSGLASALHLLHRAGQCADVIFADAMVGSNLTPRQFAVLKAVAESRHPSQTDLAARTGIDRSTLADIVRRLVKRELLSRERSRQDARAYIVSVSDAGHDAIARAEPAAQVTDQRLMASLTVSERMEFLSALSRIVERYA